MNNKLTTQQTTGLELVNKIIQDNSVIRKMEMSLRVADTLSKPIIRTVFKDKGEEVYYFITILVKRFMDSFGFSTKMNDAQLEMLTVDTLENFNYETVEDLILFFKMCRSGKFGVTNRGVDSNLIYGEWFPMYLDLKSDARETAHQEKKVQITDDSRGATNEEVANSYKIIADKKKLNQVEIYVEKITKRMDRQLLEDTIVDWEKDPQRKPYVHLLKIKRKTLK